MTDPFKDDPPRPIYRQQSRSAVLSILMVLIGLVLLLPGACALFFLSMGGGTDGALVMLWLVCFAISAGGVVLIAKAFR